MKRMLISLCACVMAFTSCSGSRSTGSQPYVPETEKLSASATMPAQCSLLPSSVGGLAGYNMRAVYGLSATDAWSVGQVFLKIATAHYNGTKWVSVPVPTLPGSQNWTEAELMDVQELSPSDVWAVGGGFLPDGSFSPIVLHWDGTTWHNIPDPIAAGLAVLRVSADAPNDVWVVASTFPSGRLTIERWDGSKWSQIPIPTRSQFVSGLFGLEAFSPSDVWVGTFDSDIFQSVTLHWNGSTIRETGLPWLIKQKPIAIASMSGTSSNDLWVFGSPDEQPLTTTYIAHHASAGWSSYVSALGGLPPAQYNVVDFRPGYAVALVASTDAQSQQGLLLWNGYVRWHAVPASIPPLGAPSGHYGPVAAIPHTTSFWTVTQSNDAHTHLAAVIQCAPQP